MKLAIKILLITILVGCQRKVDDSILKSPHAYSPEKKAIIYQTSFVEGKGYRISLTTWIETAYATGGAGVFDIHVDTLKNLKFKWTTDTSVKIIYPEKAHVLRKELKTYFNGRTIFFNYEVEK